MKGGDGAKVSWMRVGREEKLRARLWQSSDSLYLVH